MQPRQNELPGLVLWGSSIRIEIQLVSGEKAQSKAKVVVCIIKDLRQKFTPQPIYGQQPNEVAHKGKE